MVSRWKVLKMLLWVLVFMGIVLPGSSVQGSPSIVGIFVAFVIFFVYYVFFYGMTHATEPPHTGARSGDLRAIRQIKHMGHGRWH